MSFPRVFYSPNHDISSRGINKLHPFDSWKASRVSRRAHGDHGTELGRLLAAQAGPPGRDALRLIQADDYLARLERSDGVASLLEMPVLRLLAGRPIHRQVSLPMRRAVQGTVDAACAAAASGGVIDLPGGYQHAHRDRGDGFCREEPSWR
jgi:acetoin utilization deacetylase AcuC-like enzyme